MEPVRISPIFNKTYSPILIDQPFPESPSRRALEDVTPSRDAGSPVWQGHDQFEATMQDIGEPSVKSEWDPPIESDAQSSDEGEPIGQFLPDLMSFVPLGLAGSHAAHTFHNEVGRADDKVALKSEESWAGEAAHLREETARLREENKQLRDDRGIDLPAQHPARPAQGTRARPTVQQDRAMGNTSPVEERPDSYVDDSTEQQRDRAMGNANPADNTDPEDVAGNQDHPQEDLPTAKWTLWEPIDGVGQEMDRMPSVQTLQATLGPRINEIREAANKRNEREGTEGRSWRWTAIRTAGYINQSVRKTGTVFALKDKHFVVCRKCFNSQRPCLRYHKDRGFYWVPLPAVLRQDVEPTDLRYFIYPKANASRSLEKGAKIWDSR